MGQPNHSSIGETLSQKFIRSDRGSVWDITLFTLDHLYPA